MKRNIKIVSLTVAALLAVSPLASLGANQTVKADTTTEQSDEDGRTFASFRNFFFRQAGPVDPATDRYVSNKKTGELSITMQNASLKLNGKEMYRANGDMPNGTYRATARFIFRGFDAKKHSRTLDLRAGNHVVGQLYIPARSHTGRGYEDFNITLTDDGAGQPQFNQHKRIVPKKATKKSRKVVNKKHSKKHTKRNKR